MQNASEKSVLTQQRLGFVDPLARNAIFSLQDIAEMFFRRKGTAIVIREKATQDDWRQNRLNGRFAVLICRGRREHLSPYLR